MPCWTNNSWPHNLNQTVSGKAGAVQDRRLADAFPRDQHRERAWFNTLNEAYVKARYSKHFEISAEALNWLGEQTALLLELIKATCLRHLEALERSVK